MIGARIDVRKGWSADIARTINLQVAEAVADASRVGAQVAASAAGARRRSGDMAEIKPVDVRGTADGWEGGFRSKAWYSGFQSRGTLGSRGRALKASTKRRRESESGQERLGRALRGGNRGISPLRHEEKGLAAAKRALLDRIDRLS